MSNTVYEIVTQSIIDRLTSAIESGETIAPWCKPWNATNSAPLSGSTGKPYRGINWFILSMSGYASPYWFTFNQVRNLKGSVRKGEKSTAVVFWAMLEGIDKASGKAKKIPMLRYYRVFNYEQCDSLPAKYAGEAGETIEFEPIARAEAVVEGWADKPVIKHEGARACYTPSLDVVTMPAKESFKGNGEYYSTLFHELVHSTGANKRLNREDMGKGSFGTEIYSKEELTAEMGAAILASYCGITSTQDNSVSYLKGWLSKLRNEPKWLVSAAGHAQKAVDMILGTPAFNAEETASEE